MKIVISGTLSSAFPIAPEQLSAMESLASNLGIAQIFTFFEHMNHTIDIGVLYSFPEPTIASDWFGEFVRKLATVIYLGEKYDLGLAGSIAVSDYNYPLGEIDVLNGVTTVQHGRMCFDVFELAGHREVINPLPRLELA